MTSRRILGLASAANEARLNFIDTCEQSDDEASLDLLACIRALLEAVDDLIGAILEESQPMSEISCMEARINDLQMAINELRTIVFYLMEPEVAERFRLNWFDNNAVQGADS